jgi:hypothetical protein
MAKEVQFRGGTTVEHAVFTGKAREITIDTDKHTVVVHDGTTPGGYSLPTHTDLAAMIYDGGTSDIKTYSSTKVQALHDAQATAIANLAGASGVIINSSSPVFNPIPLVATDMPFSVSTQSTNINIFEFDDANNTITFKRDGNYNFLSTVVFQASASGTHAVTFDLVNTADDSVLVSQINTIDMLSGNIEFIPMNTLLTVGAGAIPAAPLTIKIMAKVDTGTTLRLNSFSSILALAASANAATVESIDTALGTIYEGLA